MTATETHTCDVAGCQEPYVYQGLCSFHLARVRVGLPLEPHDDEQEVA